MCTSRRGSRTRTSRTATRGEPYLHGEETVKGRKWYIDTVKRLFGPSKAGIGQADNSIPAALSSSQGRLLEAEREKTPHRPQTPKPDETILTPRGIKVTRHRDGALTIRYPNGVVCTRRESEGEDRHGRYRRVETVKTFPQGYRTRNGGKLKTLTRIQYHYLEPVDRHTETRPERRGSRSLRQESTEPDSSRRLLEGRIKPGPAGRFPTSRSNLEHKKEVIICSRPN